MTKQKLFHLLILAILTVFGSGRVSAEDSTILTNWARRYSPTTNVQNSEFTGTFDQHIDFDWRLGGPYAESDNFSLEWSTAFSLEETTGTLQLTLLADDSMSVLLRDSDGLHWLGGTQGAWKSQQITRQLPAGNYELIVRYQEFTHYARAQVIAELFYHRLPQPTVRYFGANRSSAQVGDPISLWWDVDAGAAPIRIVAEDSAHPLGQPFSVPPVGELPKQRVDTTVSAACPADIHEHAVLYRLEWFDGANWQGLKTLRVDVIDGGEWFFMPNGMGRPCRSSEMTTAAYQPFENGRMVWLANTDQVYVIVHDDPHTVYKFTDEWDESLSERVTDEQPPAGLVAPVRGFGKVWAENEQVRTALGWATAPELGYQAQYQYTMRWEFGRNGQNPLTPIEYFTDSEQRNLFVIDTDPVPLVGAPINWQQYPLTLRPSEQ